MTIESVVFKDFNIVQNRGHYVSREVDESVQLVGGMMQKRKVVKKIRLEPEDFVIPSDVREHVLPATVAAIPRTGYKLVVYAGPNVIQDKRTPVEHKCADTNYHVHFREVNARNGDSDIRINCGTFEEIEGGPIPKDLRKYLKKLKKGPNKDSLTNIARAYYERGEIDMAEVKKLL